MASVSNRYITTFNKYHLACFDPASMFVMKKSLSFEIKISLLGCLSDLW